MLHHQFEAMLRAGQNGAVLCRAETHFPRPDPDPDPEESVWVAVWACRAAGGLKEWGQAVAWADRGLGLEPGDPEAEGILRFSAARALMYVGDLFRSERELRQFLRLAEGPPKLQRVVGDALYNLGHLQRLLGRPGEAVGSFLQAGRLHEGAGRRLGMALCRYEMGWTHLLEGRPAEALPDLLAAREAMKQLSDPELEADLSIAMALYHTLCGELAESDRLCQELLEGHDLPNRQRAEVDWLLGRNALRRGELAVAAEHLAVAHEAAVEDWWPPQMERISLLRENLVARGAAGR